MKRRLRNRRGCLHAGSVLALLLSVGCVKQIDVVKIPTLSPAFFRVNCGAAESFTDSLGNVWQPDQEFAEGKEWGYIGGSAVDRRQAGLTEIDRTDDDAVYLTERYSMEGYKFVLPEGKYLLRLHFAETYDGITGEGMRVFSVTAEGKAILEDFDPYKVAGDRNKPIIRQFTVEVSDGSLDIGFVPNVQNPEINGIEVLMK
jgi:hypothetical protein